MRSIIGLLTLIPCTAIAQPPPGYYDAAAGLTGLPLRVALQGIIDDHAVLANSELWDAFSLIDRRPDGTVWDIYSDVPGGTPPYTFTFGVDQCGNYDGEGDCFNREHSFPQSWFDGAPAMDTDLFHIFPTDAWVNQKRANWPYGEVDAPTWTSDNGGKLGPCALPDCSGLVFEPIDAYKGDLARGHFYMLTRYYGSTSAWPAPILADGEFLPWVEGLLLAWHATDPVSQKEVERNNAIFDDVQYNRNPFIDHPEWVASIWGPTAGIVEDQELPLTITVIGHQAIIELKEPTDDANAVLFDLLGAQCGFAKLSPGVNRFDLPQASGVHLLRVTGEGRSKSVRLVH